jgi:GntR family transcriptional regulator, transcriptional repressor for pyruvate dehydrogenase complex
MPAYPGGQAAELAAALGPLPSRTPVSEVAWRLLELFTSGAVTVGTRLPPERQLSERLGVGRSAVREALAALEILGIVDVRAGSGTYLRNTASELLPQTLRWGLLIGERNTAELIELRSGLEIYAARLASSRASADSEAELEGSLERMRENVGRLDRFVEADRAFHGILAETAANHVLVDTLQVVRSLLRIYEDRAVTDQREAAVAVREHDEILRAVVARDPDMAASAMATHMATASSRLAVGTREIST